MRFSRRNAPAHQTALVYDSLPTAFRVQVVLICKGVLGEYASSFRGRAYHRYQVDSPAVKFWEAAARKPRLEFGRLSLAKDPKNAFEECSIFLRHAEPSEVLDAIDVIFYGVHGLIDEHYTTEARSYGAHLSREKAIEQLNDRFAEHSLAYRFVEGRLIDLRSEYLHSDTIEPAFRLLHAPGFEGALEEFTNAQKRFEHVNGRRRSRRLQTLSKAQ
jgi:hypothetical protein